MNIAEKSLSLEKDVRMIVIPYSDYEKIKKEMSLLKDMFQNIKSVVCELKHNIQVHKKKNRNASTSTDSGMSSETKQNINDAKTLANSNTESQKKLEKPKRSIKKKVPVEPEETPKSHKAEIVARPEIPLLYGLIRHNPRKNQNNNNEMKFVDKSTVKTEQKDNSLASENKTPITYMHKKKRACNITKNTENNKSSEREKMIAIGAGKTFVSKELYKKINWDSYTLATRKLLMAVFPRKILATHSLTGKASPAFANKPAKLSLDAKKIQDIVITVSDKCKVKENLVRNAITTKCADENKMLRLKQQKTAADAKWE